MNIEIFGFLLVDKPKDITSHDVVYEVRRLLNCKVGHTGTLDPFATGLLILALGKATRLAEFVQSQDKTYEVEMKLGELRDSFDVTGVLVEKKPFDNVTKKLFQHTAEKYIGEIEQIPPKYSAIKVNGVRAYKLAREGKEVILKKRNVKIHKITLQEFSPPVVRSEVSCSSGTYIRALVNDLALQMNTVAYTSSLKRTSIGSYSIQEALSLSALQNLKKSEIYSKIISPIQMLEKLSHLNVTESQLADIVHGRQFSVNDLSTDVNQSSSVMAVYENRIVAVGTIIEHSDTKYFKPSKVFA